MSKARMFPTPRDVPRGEVLSEAAVDRLRRGLGALGVEASTLTGGQAAETPDDLTPVSSSASVELPDLAATKYVLGQPLDRGGMGIVYRAWDRELEREVALKVLALADPDGSIAERMVREARVLARLEHPGIVPIHDVGRLADGRVFTVMKLVRGERLDQSLAARAGTAEGATHPADERRPESSSERTVAERLRVFLRICEAVAFAHAQGVVHRDLKPANVMVGAFGEVLVMDWGLAKLLSSARWGGSGTGDGSGDAAVYESRREPAAPAAAPRSPPGGDEVTAAGAILGTPGYMAPEQERGEVDRIDARTDVYGLGAILRDLVAAGFGGARPPRPLAAIVERALAARPEDRYAGAAELAADVERFLAREPVAAYRERPLERLRRWIAKYDTAVLLVVTYLLLRVLFVVFSRR